jgi:hypothetical protein
MNEDDCKNTINIINLKYKVMNVWDDLRIEFLIERYCE